jgi:cell division protein FtsZ
MPSMPFDFISPSLVELKPRICVIGVGGAGGNAVANMITDGLSGVDFVVANTDAQSLALSPAERRIQLGLKITQGLGAGARPEIGAAAAEEAIAEIDGALDGYHMCFIAAGMGGGTGTGAAPVVARAARERGVLTVGVVTKPFAFEGMKRMRAAEEGIAELQRHVDTLIVIPNQNLFLIANQQTSFRQAFAMADEVLNQGVRGITDLMLLPGLINLDFADVRTVMSEMGKAMMGTGEAEGQNRAVDAADKAISNPLLDEVSLRGAKAVIINITGGEDLGLMEVEAAAQHIREMVDPEANIIVGSAFNGALEGKMRVSVVATGIEARQGALPGIAAQPQMRPAAGASIFGRPAGLPPANPGAGETPPPAPPSAPAPVPPGLPSGGGQPKTLSGGAAAAVPAMTLAAPDADDIGLSDEDILELEEPVAAVPEPPAPMIAPMVARLPLPEPQPAVVDPEAGGPLAAEPEEPKLTLFERMLKLSRKPRIEDQLIDTLAPEPEPEARDDTTAIPPFMRVQRN